jgi:hypothetical protein
LRHSRRADDDGLIYRRKSPARLIGLGYRKAVISRALSALAFSPANVEVVAQDLLTFSLLLVLR